MGGDDLMKRLAKIEAAIKSNTEKIQSNTEKIGSVESRMITCQVGVVYITPSQGQSTGHIMQDIPIELKGFKKTPKMVTALRGFHRGFHPGDLPRIDVEGWAKSPTSAVIRALGYVGKDGA